MGDCLETREIVILTCAEHKFYITIFFNFINFMNLQRILVIVILNCAELKFYITFFFSFMNLQRTLMIFLCFYLVDCISANQSSIWHLFGFLTYSWVQQMCTIVEDWWMWSLKSASVFFIYLFIRGTCKTKSHHWTFKFVFSYCIYFDFVLLIY